MRPLLLLSVVLLAVGVGVIFGYCNGSTGFSFAYPFSGTSLHLDITTTGVPALIGIPLTLLGAFLLILAWFLALFHRRKQEVVDDLPPRRREEPFQG
ncbi:MAG TPA: hypothetical protein VK764_09605 [Terracidiphilus sp.]|nr:hypothetical protein [Terracidiphilus sp.]